MSINHYMIREKLFDYENDFYNLSHFQLGEIIAVYTDKITAEQALHALTVDYLHEHTLSEYDVYQHLDTAALEQLNAQMQQRFDVAILTEYGHLVDVMPEALSDAEVFDLAKQLGILPYQLQELSDENYVIWHNQLQQYLRFPDPYSNPFSPSEDYCGSLIWGQSADFLLQHPQKNQFLQQLFTQVLDAHSQFGTLAQLSHHPEQLANCLATHTQLWRYDQQRLSCIGKITAENYPALQAVNELLNLPFFEIQQVSFAQLKLLIQQETVQEVR